MISLDSISRIGLGTYRMGNLAKEDAKAMHFAIQSGCNLLDTASNYLYGKSEEFIGQYIKENPKKELFLVTKAGYISRHDERVIKLLLNKMPAEEITTYDTTRHCIHPAFLKKQIDKSLKRLNRKWLDGFLLHNPEYFLKASAHPEKAAIYYKRIQLAFEFLEELVQKGVIRYYGISSNTLAYPGGHHEATDLSSLLKAAAMVSSTHHFKLIQFPYNLVENNATTIMSNDGSLVGLAKKNGIISFANRPLNVHADTGFMRLAIYDDPFNKSTEAKAERSYASFLDMIRKQLRKKGSTDDPLDFEIMMQFSKVWNRAGNHGAVDLLFSHLSSFLTALFEYPVIVGPIVESQMKRKEQKIVLELYSYCLLYATRIMSEKSKSFLEGLKAKGLVDKNDTRPLPVIACEHYLANGIDHVLVGMRKKKYIEELKHLF